MSNRQTIVLKKKDQILPANKRFNKIKRYSRETTIERHYRLSYGLTIQQVEEMKKNQNYLCAICLKKPKGIFIVDHCHECGKVRAMLCTRCNSILGVALDDPDRLRAAANYLDVFHSRRHRKKKFVALGAAR